MKKHLFDGKYLKRVGAGFLTAAVSIAFIAYILYHAFSSVTDDFSSVYSRKLSYSDTIECDSYIMRDEVVLKSDNGSVGTPSSIVGEGGKAAANDKVADIYASYDKATSEKIGILESQIKFYNRYKTQSGYGKTESIDDTIAENIDMFAVAAFDGNAHRAVSYRDKIISDIMRREVMTGQINDFDGEITKLEDELRALKLKLGSSVGNVYAPAGGYYFTTTDGYEEILSSSAVDEMTYSDFYSKLREAPRDTSSDAGKLVKDYRWYVVCPMSDSEARQLTVGNTYSVTLERNVLYPTDMMLYKVIGGGDGSLAVFRCDRITDGYDYTRMQTASISVSDGECFKVPLSSLREYDGETGVYVLDKVTVEFRRVEIIREENGFVLVELPGEEEEGKHPWLRENEVVIVTGTGLKPGMTYSPS